MKLKTLIAVAALAFTSVVAAKPVEFTCSLKATVLNGQMLIPGSTTSIKHESFKLSYDLVEGTSIVGQGNSQTTEYKLMGPNGDASAVLESPNGEYAFGVYKGKQGYSVLLFQSGNPSQTIFTDCK